MFSQLQNVSLKSKKNYFKILLQKLKIYFSNSTKKSIDKIRGAIGIYDIKQGGNLKFESVLTNKTDVIILKLKKKIDKFKRVDKTIVTSLPICIPPSSECF